MAHVYQPLRGWPKAPTPKALDLQGCGEPVRNANAIAARAKRRGRVMEIQQRYEEALRACGKLPPIER
jgi:hypothetical protein